MSKKKLPSGWSFVGERYADGTPVLFVPGLPARDITYDEAAAKGWLALLQGSALYEAADSTPPSLPPDGGAGEENEE